jgi:hypothetical protein
MSPSKIPEEPKVEGYFRGAIAAPERELFDDPTVDLG